MLIYVFDFSQGSQVDVDSGIDTMEVDDDSSKSKQVISYYTFYLGLYAKVQCKCQKIQPSIASQLILT